MGTSTMSSPARKLEEFPLPAELPLEFGRELDALAQQLAALSRPRSCADGDADSRPAWMRARAEHERDSRGG